MAETTQLRPALAPELETTIAEAIAELDGAAAEARLANDPLRAPLAALAALLRAQRRLFVDGALTIGEAVKVGRQPLDKGQTQELMDRVARAAAVSIGAQAAVFGRRFSQRTVVALFVAAAGLVMCGISVGWLGSRLFDARPNVTNCIEQPQPAGGLAYACTFWMRTPR